MLTKLQTLLPSAEFPHAQTPHQAEGGQKHGIPEQHSLLPFSGAYQLARAAVFWGGGPAALCGCSRVASGVRVNVVFLPSVVVDLGMLIYKTLWVCWLPRKNGDSHRPGRTGRCTTPHPPTRSPWGRIFSILQTGESLNY